MSDEEEKISVEKFSDNVKPFVVGTKRRIVIDWFSSLIAASLREFPSHAAIREIDMIRDQILVDYENMKIIKRYKDEL